VSTCAADPGFAHLVQRPLLGQNTLERAKLAVGGGRLTNLQPDQVTPPGPESMELEHEAAEVTNLDLPQVTEVARSPLQPAPVAESERPRQGVEVNRRRVGGGLGELGGWGCGGRGDCGGGRGHGWGWGDGGGGRGRGGGWGLHGGRGLHGGWRWHGGRGVHGGWGLLD